LNIHNVSDVRQIEVHTEELLVPGPSHLEVEISIAKLEKYTSKYNYTELIQAGGDTLLSSFHKLINSIWNKEEVPDPVEGVYYGTNSQKGC
jgi:hypothetical protein